MVYGDIQFLDLLIFAGIAAFLIYRLRNILGKRAGFQNKKNDQQVENIEPIPEKTIPNLKENEVKLKLVYDAIPDFDHKNFLSGAKYAFETIINAFNNCDKKTLKNLLTKDVYLSFEKAIEEEGNNKNFQFYSLVVESVEEVVVKENHINITLKITSEQFKDNDESTVIKKQDVWTFQKNIKNKSPIWLLSST
jgi:predicted lipid-binding transport protein (Tim44 family)